MTEQGKGFFRTYEQNRVDTMYSTGKIDARIFPELAQRQEEAAPLAIPVTDKPSQPLAIFGYDVKPGDVATALRVYRRSMAIHGFQETLGFRRR